MEEYSADKQHAFPCQQCGAELNFQPGTESLACNHCGHSHQIKQSLSPIVEYDFHSTVKELPGAAKQKVVIAIDCHACSAEFEFDSNIHADQCPFCGSSIVTDASEHKQIQPESLLPFAIDQSEADSCYKKWLNNLWFAPNKLKRYAKKEKKLNGIYVPYWTYDSNTTTHYSGQRGTHYQVPKTVSVVVNGKRTTRTQMVTKVRWTPASGVVQRNFDDILIYATDSLPRSMARELAPWDLGELKPYQEEYLSGFQSEVYKVELDKGFDIAKDRMHPVIRNDIRHDIGGDQQRIHSANTQYRHIRFKHILLPFWVAGFRFRSRTFQFIVNGRTGEVQGDRPYSWVKITAAIIALGILVAGIAYLAKDSGYY